MRDEAGRSKNRSLAWIDLFSRLDDIASLLSTQRSLNITPTHRFLPTPLPLAFCLLCMTVMPHYVIQSLFPLRAIVVVVEMRPLDGLDLSRLQRQDRSICGFRQRPGQSGWSADPLLPAGCIETVT